MTTGLSTWVRQGRRVAAGLLWVAGLLGGVAVGQPSATYVYAVRDTALSLDVYRPAVARADSACVVAVFGGGFVSGSRADSYQQLVAARLVERGFTVVSPDYRLGLRDSVRVAAARRPSQLMGLFQWAIDMAAEDCAAAVAYVVEHASELGVHPDRVVLTGSSAGAIAVLQLDWCRANGLPAASDLPQGWRPAAVVPYAGAVMCKGRPRYATPPAPTMLMHGKKDKIVAYGRFPHVVCHALYGTRTVARQMRRGGHAVWSVRFAGVGHEVASWLPGSIDLFCAFVDQALAGRVSDLDATMTDSELRPTQWTTMNVFDLYRK